jgi:hypothetical protein
VPGSARTAAVWVLWGFDTLIALVFVGFFVVGLADGSVSSFNIVLWLAILAGLGLVTVGGLLLRRAGQTLMAVVLLLLLALPGLLAVVFFLVVLIAQPRWN